MNYNDNKKLFLILGFAVLLIVLTACAPKEVDPQKVVDDAIAAHGGELYNNSLIEFDFRGRQYKAKRDGWKFVYERNFYDSTLGQVRDVKTNDSTYREVNGEWLLIDDKLRRSIDGGVNSVIYFALLPQALNDKAVVKKYLGDTEISGKQYHEIEVTFKQEGGGVDYEDRYVYWFNKEDKTMDYLTYFFYVNDSGSRFRQIYNERNVGGILFSDHSNFKSEDMTVDNIEQYDSIMAAGKLEKVSEIILENVKVTPLN